jgi:tetratricopeptide (TPR) repeat protein
MFADAAGSNPRNLWLWVNWGELLAMQGKLDASMAKYREAIIRPMTHDTYDRARDDAYQHLLKLIERRGDFDSMEALYKQRLAEFGPGSCYSTDYARFLLQVRGNARGAIDLTRRALNQSCEDSPAREVLGMAEYVTWSSTSGSGRTEALNQARVFLPAGPKTLYLLATGDRTLVAAKMLISAGERIDQKDNSQMTALAIALHNTDLPAARRLLALGSRPDVPVGYEEIPVALIPVMEHKVESVRAMQKWGIDYSKLRYRGVTAYNIAKQSGDTALIEALAHNGTLL